MTLELSYFTYLIIVFFVISVFGWCMEVVLKYRQFHRFINRGFLIGPYLPIYGSGVVFITIVCALVKKYDNSYGTIFLASFIICGMWEYFVSFLFEKRFHARWWDYTQKPMNLNGRVWIGNLILFGIGGLIVEVFVTPFFKTVIGRIPLNIQLIISGLIAVIMLTDYGFSHFIMKFIKAGIEGSEADNTEDISKEIRLLLKDKSVLYTRVIEAYPNVEYRTEKIKARLEAIKQTTELIRVEAEKYKEETADKIREIEAVLENKVSAPDKIAQTKPGTIFDYMKWRGNLSLEVDSFNAIDGVILSQLPYIDLHDYLADTSFNNSISVTELSDRFFAENDIKELTKKISMTKNAIFVLRAMAETERFKNMRLFSYIEDISESEQSQFAAVSIDLGNGTVYISFSGTDNTIVGWREDFNMAYIQMIPGQHKAVEYIEDLKLPATTKLIIGGHSKGGNLAVAAGMYSSKDIQNRIVKIYNNDGPGFSKEVIASEAYQNTLGKVCSISPESSIVGMLFNHSDDYQIIKSSNNGLKQHDALSWLVLGTAFIDASEASKTVTKLDDNISRWMDELDIEQRKLFVDTIFGVLEKANIKTVDDFLTEKILLVPKILISQNDISAEDKKKISEIIKLLVEATKPIKSNN